MKTTLLLSMLVLTAACTTTRPDYEMVAIPHCVIGLYAYDPVSMPLMPCYAKPGGDIKRGRVLIKDSHGSIHHIWIEPAF